MSRVALNSVDNYSVKSQTAEHLQAELPWEPAAGGAPVGGATAGGAAVGGAAVGGAAAGGAAVGGAAVGGAAVGGAAAGGAPVGGAAAGGAAVGGAAVGGAAAGGAAAGMGGTPDAGGNVVMAGTPAGGVVVGGQPAPQSVSHMPTIESVACVISAIRNASGCGAIADCMGAVEAGPMGCAEDDNICLPQPSDMCRDYCAAQGQCNPELDLFQCRRLCTPDPDYLAVRSTCAGLVAGCVGAQDCARWPACLQGGAFPDACADVNQCDKQNACQDLDGAIPEACVAACDTVEACGANLIGNAAEAIAPTMEQCRIDCAAQSALVAEGRDAFLQGLGQCLADAACDPGVVTRCMREHRLSTVRGSHGDARMS